MKISLAAILIISSLTISALGVYGMHSGMLDHQSACVLSIIQGVDCPWQANIFESIYFHFGTFKNLSSAVLLNVAALLLIFINMCYRQRLSLISIVRWPYSLDRYVRDFSWLYDSRATRKYISWLALHQNSPSIV